MLFYELHMHFSSYGALVTRHLEAVRVAALFTQCASTQLLFFLCRCRCRDQGNLRGNGVQEKIVGEKLPELYGMLLTSNRALEEVDQAEQGLARL